jgi:hypothetical protein
MLLRLGIGNRRELEHQARRPTSRRKVLACSAGYYATLAASSLTGPADEAETLLRD